jgi:hypothetical protein
MGEITYKEAENVLKYCKDWIIDRYNRITNLSGDEFILFIIVLAQYIYAYCCVNNLAITKVSKYFITPNDVNKISNDTEISDMAKNIVYARNKLSHEFNSPEALEYVYGIKSKINVLRKLMNCIGFKDISDEIEDTLSKAINSMSCK